MTLYSKLEELQKEAFVYDFVPSSSGYNVEDIVFYMSETHLYEVFYLDCTTYANVYNQDGKKIEQIFFLELEDTVPKFMKEKGAREINC